MAHIDFGRAFSAPNNNLPSASASHPKQEVGLAAGDFAHDKRSRFLTTPRLGRAQWTNIGFTAVSFIGGLFCAFYLFNGSEVWRAAVAWPRELLYRRPGAVMTAVDLDENQPGIFADQDSPTAADHSGDPFSRAHGFVSLAPSSIVRPSGLGGGLPTTAMVSMTHAPFAQLGFPVPGGDAFKQEFERAVADLSHSAKMETARTVVIIETTATKVQKRRSTKPRREVKRENAAKNSVQPRPTASVPPRQNGANFSNGPAQQIVNSATSTLSSVTGEIGSATGHTPINLGGRH